MKQATLYTIQSHSVVCGDYFEMAKTCGPMPSLIRVREDGIIPADMPTVEIERLPVHGISKIEHGERKTDYIVLEPELREILEAPFVGMISQLEYEKGQLIRENNQLNKKNRGLEFRLDVFNTKNWFQRVWHVICKGLV